MIKKLSMLTVKAAVGLLPVGVKKSLKKNARLTEFYSRSLQRSGLFFGFPSPKKLQALYNKRLNQQARELSEYAITQTKCQVVIAGDNATKVLHTITSFDEEYLAIVTLIVEDEIFSQISAAINNHIIVKPFSTFADIDSTPALLIRQGESVDTKRLLQTLTKYNASLEGQVTYFDWHYVDKKGTPVDPQLLPDWNPDLQLSTGYIKTAIWLQNPVEWLQRFPLNNNYYCWLAKFGLANESAVFHIPYSILAAPGSYAEDKIDLVALANEPADKAAGTVDKNNAVVNLMWPLHTAPLVSLIIPTYNGKELVRGCIESILEKTTYQNYEIILVDNNSDDPACLAYFEQLNRDPKITVLKFPYPFNYSAINNFAVKHAKGEIIGLINNDIEIITPEWLEYMAGHAMRANIGCVGAKLLYADGRLQHAGVVLGYGGGAGHAHKYFPRNHAGYLKRIVATHNYSAVTAACLLVKKTLFNEVGGLDESNLKVAFNDVDFCLRVRETGVHNLYCAEAEMFHYESISRGLDISPEKAQRFKQELDFLQTNWVSYIEHDPAYNPNLTLRRENFSIKE
ncbi:glycosyltransferase family 2 protein [Alteromonas ponticola]|uniref:Glycosyltransferase family 2 protein n=1 Tax=Alteromonas aquimaris TaxID=2998417 RepID=A0ABT3P7K8_9ALTE|nr:glycosyltransferase family 2 protein [Alteromonas aquimaris]MCW8108076.1 glycosyltransferase family 2 protein [Alteromonas aquimaris]